MSWSGRTRHALPAGVLAVVSTVDLVVGREQTVLGLLAIAPLTAAATLGRRATATYGVVALADALLLGVYAGQYTSETIVAQLTRLFAVVLATTVAVLAATLRLYHEEELARLSAQAALSRAVVRTAETLQRHLLGKPPRVPHLETAVRYQPASRNAQVGGDWYDLFALPDGGTMLVIGDVAGHDAPAAAVMAQTRGMLRGVAQSVDGSPAAVLGALDRAFATLQVDTLVTVAVARVDQVPADGAGRAAVRLRWSNAGHPPPVLVCADGTTILLERRPDPLLGVLATAVRTDHEVPLAPGDTVLFYTDGLVERRTTLLDEGTAWLLGTLRRIGPEPLDRLCDDLLREIGGQVDDDVALLAVRVPLT
ncbi:PP2C family protein-serine/threonine phosphatase [Blastococcus deserti]|uniref:PP2C family protein-serine/threonine phosphatase n=1 Tax=Blastococcus deserti TaxID=2259033 RepID=A0ABW4XEG1_9ACTN